MVDNITIWSIAFSLIVPLFGILFVWNGFKLIRMKKWFVYSIRSKQVKSKKYVRIILSSFIIFGGFVFVVFGIYFLPKTLDFSGLTIKDDANHHLSKYISETNPILTDQLRQINTDEVFNYPFISKSNSGFYLPTTRSIMIKESEISREIYWHELFHHIWFWKLTDDERAAFSALHELDMKRNILNIGKLFPFPSRYSMTSAEEDWADSGLLFAAGRDNVFGKELDESRYEIIELSIRRITNCNEMIARDCLFTVIDRPRILSVSSE